MTLREVRCCYSVGGIEDANLGARNNNTMYTCIESSK